MEGSLPAGHLVSVFLHGLMACGGLRVLQNSPQEFLQVVGVILGNKDLNIRDRHRRGAIAGRIDHRNVGIMGQHVLDFSQAVQMVTGDAVFGQHMSEVIHVLAGKEEHRLAVRFAGVERNHWISSFLVQDLGQRGAMPLHGIFNYFKFWNWVQ